MRSEPGAKAGSWDLTTREPRLTTCLEWKSKVVLRAAGPVSDRTWVLRAADVPVDLEPTVFLNRLLIQSGSAAHGTDIAQLQMMRGLKLKLWSGTLPSLLCNGKLHVFAPGFALVFSPLLLPHTPRV